MVCVLTAMRTLALDLEGPRALARSSGEGAEVEKSIGAWLWEEAVMVGLIGKFGVAAFIPCASC